MKRPLPKKQTGVDLPTVGGKKSVRPESRPSAKRTGVSITTTASAEQCREFVQTLDSLGYTSDFSSSEPIQEPDGHSLQVVLIGFDYPQEPATTFGRSAVQPRSVLAVIHHRSSVWRTNIAAQFREVVCWPCHPDELRWRLESVARPVSFDCTELPFITDGLVGESESFRRMTNELGRIIRCDAPVLIEGETGTGKELVARAIHYRGGRSNQPFVPVNCGALPDDLVENELFGHQRGAYTGAQSSHKGLASQADKGTLFLDEVNALSPKGQVVLLRFLEEKVVRPLGDEVPHTVDVRVIAACNKPFDLMVERGEMREDLYYRLKVLAIQVPPLRDRSQDVVLLANYFLRRLVEKYGDEKFFHPDSLEAAARHRWPGNVRELENAVERSVLMSDSAAVWLEAPKRRRSQNVDTPREFLGQDFNDAKAVAVAKFERRYLRALMVQTRGNVSKAAKLVGKERRALGKLLSKHNIDRREYTGRR